MGSGQINLVKREARKPSYAAQIVADISLDHSSRCFLTITADLCGRVLVWKSRLCEVGA